VIERGRVVRADGPPYALAAESRLCGETREPFRLAKTNKRCEGAGRCWLNELRHVRASRDGNSHNARLSTRRKQPLRAVSLVGCRLRAGFLPRA
jgi:hypothetical protein